MWISSAMAQDAAPVAGAVAAAPGMVEMLLPLVLIFFIFYFLLIRPQQKAMRTEAEMRKGIKRGDMILTTGGLIVKVAKAEDDELQVELSEGVKVRLARSGVSAVLDAQGKPVVAAKPVPANKKA